MFEIIVNPSSKCGMGEKIWQIVEKELIKNAISYHVHKTKKSGEATEMARKLMLKEGTSVESLDDAEKSGAEKDTIVVLGGDGTLNEVLQGINPACEPHIAYIPTGSGNDFARGMGLETEPEKAINDIIVSEKTRKIDIGNVNGRKFIVSAGIGWDAAICHNLLNSFAKKLLNKIHLGKLSYLIIGIKQWLICKKVDGELILDGEKHIKLHNMIFTSAHNLKYEGGGYMFAPEALPDDGLLELCVVSNIGKLRMLPTILSGKNGNHGKFKGVDFYKCRKAEIHLDKPMPIHADGESCGRSGMFSVVVEDEKVRVVV